MANETQPPTRKTLRRRMVNAARPDTAPEEYPSAHQVPDARVHFLGRRRKMIQNAGAEPTKATNSGMTPLFLAQKNGHMDVVNILNDVLNTTC